MLTPCTAFSRCNLVLLLRFSCLQYVVVVLHVSVMFTVIILLLFVSGGGVAGGVGVIIISTTIITACMSFKARDVFVIALFACFEVERSAQSVVGFCIF